VQEAHSFWDSRGCEYVDLILTGAPPDDFESFFLWRLRTHVGSCSSCQTRHPNALTFLSHEIAQREAALVLDLEAIRGEYLAEASAIGREAIMSRPSGAIFPLDDILIDHTFGEMYADDAPPGEETSLKLITSLKRGAALKRCWKQSTGWAWLISTSL
jgi:hypothetical protein